MDFNGKKLLVIGGAYQHNKLVEAAHELGVIVYVVDYWPLEKAVAKQIADYHYEVDIFDINAILDICKKEKIDGAIAAYHDTCQIPYMEVCQKMGYPCLGNENQHFILTNKKAFKAFCIENDVDVIPSYDESLFPGEGIKLQQSEYPLLVKPSVNRGSKGLTICNCYEDVIPAIEFARSFSSDNKVIIEKYMGQKNDLQLAYIVLQGKPFLLRVEDRFLGTKEDGLDKLCIATVAPSICEQEYIDNAHPKAVHLIQKLGLHDSLVFIQGFMDGDKCRFYDPGLRLPGNDYDRIYKASTGIDIPKMLVKFALTGKYQQDDIDSFNGITQKKATSMLFPDVRPGTIKEIKGIDELLQHPNILAVNMLFAEGDQVEETHNVKQRLCEIDILCDSIEELKNIITWIQSHLSVKDIHGNEMIYAEFDIKHLNQYGK